MGEPRAGPAHGTALAERSLVSDSQEEKAMNKRGVSFRKFSSLSGNRTLVVGACVCAGLIGLPMGAQAQTADATASTEAAAPVIPNHLAVGNQIFEANVTGLRAYLDSIKTTQPQVYAQLAPDVERLESQRSTARTVLVAGVVAGLAAGIYGFAGRPSCQNPPLSDPNFAAHSDAWSSCNEHNVETMAAFGFIGVGAIVAGGLAAWAIAPSRSDLLDVVNKNNRLSPEPLHLQLGYDPSRELAFAGAALTF